MNLSVADKLADRPLCWTSWGSASSRAAGRARSRRTRSSSSAPRRSSTCATPSSPRSARPASRASARSTTRRCAPSSTRRPPSSPSSRSSDLRHAERALRTTGEENIAMIADTVAFLVREGRRVVVDAEHFFDGYRFDADYARAAVVAGFEAGAEIVALCDTNGGMVPTLGRGHRARACAESSAPTPCWACTRTTTPAAPSPTRWPPSRRAHATCRARSTATASGPATPTCSRSSPTSSSSTGARCSPRATAASPRPTRIAHAISEITNISPFARAPYVGASAFAHKAGLHAWAIKIDPDLYQHIDPTRSATTCACSS